MASILSIPFATLYIVLLAAYCVAAVDTLWRQRNHSFRRFLPLAAAVGLVTNLRVSARLAPPFFVLMVLPLLTAVCVQAWRGRAWRDRSLRMLGAVWVLWGSLSVVLDFLRA